MGQCLKKPDSIPSESIKVYSRRNIHRHNSTVSKRFSTVIPSVIEPSNQLEIIYDAIIVAIPEAQVETHLAFPHEVPQEVPHNVPQNGSREGLLHCLEHIYIIEYAELAYNILRKGAYTLLETDTKTGRTALMYAAIYLPPTKQLPVYNKIVKTILYNAPSLDWIMSTDNQGYSALTYACRYNNLQLVLQILEAYKFPDKQIQETILRPTVSGYTAIHWACINRNKVLAMKLLELIANNAIPDTSNINPWVPTPLITAACNNMSEVVNQLLNPVYKINIWARSATGKTAEDWMKINKMPLDKLYSNNGSSSSK